MRRDVFQAIADPNRRAILGLLAGKKMTVNEVAEQFPVSRPAISKHLKILSECGLIQMDTHGRERYCEARLSGLKEVSDWTEKYRVFWHGKLDSLESFLAQGLSAQKKSSPEK